MDKKINTQFGNLEIEVNTKYKGKIKEEMRERAMLSLDFLLMFIFIIVLIIMSANDQYDVLKYEIIQDTVIILLCLAAIGVFLAAIFAPFFVKHNHGLKGIIKFAFYKNEKDEIRCRCIGTKRSRNFTYDEPCEKIKFEKYSIRVYYKTFHFFRIPLSQLSEIQIEQFKNIQKYIK